MADAQEPRLSQYTVGLAFYDQAVDVGDVGGTSQADTNKSSFLRNLFCAAGSVKQAAVDMYQRGQRYTHCEAYFTMDGWTRAELARVRMPADSLNPDGSVKAAAAKNLVVAFSSFSAVSAAHISRAKGIQHIPGHPACQQSDGVIAMGRVFSSRKYQTLSFQVTPEKYHLAKNFALSQLGKPYDRYAASWRILVLPPSPTEKRWWCASLSHAILKKIGVLQWQPLNTLNVGALVYCASRSSRHDPNISRPHEAILVARAVGEMMFGPTLPPGKQYQTVRAAAWHATRGAVETSCHVVLPPVNVPASQL